MNWTEPQEPKKGVSWYDHVTLETPLGTFRIEWKSWKEFGSYDISIDDDYNIFESEYDLESAKEKVRDFLTEKHKELSEILSINVLLISKAPEMLEDQKENYAYMEELAMLLPSEYWTEDFRDRWNSKMNKTEKLIKEATELP
jgi:hypothetical protein